MIFHENLGYYDAFIDPSSGLEKEMRSAEGGATQGRFQIIQYTYSLLERKALLLIGLGPGQGEQNLLGAGIQGEYFSNYTDFTRTQVSRTLLEFGILGLLINLLMIYQIYKMNRRFFSKIDDLYWKAISLGFFSFIFVFATAIVYREVWYKPPLAFFFWFLGGVIFNIGKKRKLF